MYLLHPDKKNTVNNVLARKRARKGLARRPKPAQPASTGVVQRLAERIYHERTRGY